jgi:hypothetical protein
MFRDELHAAQERVRSLEQQVTDLQSDKERAEGLENQLEAIQRQLDSALGELNQLRRVQGGKPPGSRVAVVAGVGLATLLVTAGAAFFLVRSPARYEAPVARPAVVEEPAAQPVVPAAPDTPAVPSGPPFEVGWKGTVSKAEGTALAVGAGCKLSAHGRGTALERAVLRCGEVVLYDSDDPLDGMSHWRRQLIERPDKSGKGLRYGLEWHDTGSRSGKRAELTASTDGAQAVASRETAPTYRVEVKLEKLSEERGGTPLFFKTMPSADPVTRDLVVASVEGSAPVAVGDSCRALLEVAAASGDELRCRAELSCGTSQVYGPGSWANCELDASGKPLRAKDDGPTSSDNDPTLELDMTSGNARLADDKRGYSMVLRSR